MTHGNNIPIIAYAVSYVTSSGNFGCLTDIDLFMLCSMIPARVCSLIECGFIEAPATQQKPQKQAYLAYTYAPWLPLMTGVKAIW